MRPKPNPQTLCQHHTAAGRRCRMLLSPDHPQLCTFHGRAEVQADQRASAKLTREQNSAITAAALLDGTENLATPQNVNHLLINVLKQFAHRRIGRRDATTYAYICQLLLNSQSVIHRHEQDAAASKSAAQSGQDRRIVIDVERPNYDDGPGAHFTPGAISPRDEAGFVSQVLTHSPPTQASQPSATRVPHRLVLWVSVVRDAGKGVRLRRRPLQRQRQRQRQRRHRLATRSFATASRTNRLITNKECGTRLGKWPW